MSEDIKDLDSEIIDQRTVTISFSGDNFYDLLDLSIFLILDFY
ncbi:hypothetical protein LCGC14_2645850 [marine sediment metagenome]|uniref:Uncharacterized protein n=1 Tax=marine sediment metagenome TaxID=412755 RepID=A0A0F9C6P7_9ZZZZ